MSVMMLFHSATSSSGVKSSCFTKIYCLQGWKNRKLQVELAISADVGEPFVKATYWLEGKCMRYRSNCSSVDPEA